MKEHIRSLQVDYRGYWVQILSQPSSVSGFIYKLEYYVIVTVAGRIIHTIPFHPLVPNKHMIWLCPCLSYKLCFSSLCWQPSTVLLMIIDYGPDIAIYTKIPAISDRTAKNDEFYTLIFPSFCASLTNPKNANVSVATGQKWIFFLVFFWFDNSLLMHPIDACMMWLMTFVLILIQIHP